MVRWCRSCQDGCTCCDALAGWADRESSHLHQQQRQHVGTSSGAACMLQCKASTQCPLRAFSSLASLDVYEWHEKLECVVCDLCDSLSVGVTLVCNLNISRCVRVSPQQLTAAAAMLSCADGLTLSNCVCCQGVVSLRYELLHHTVLRAGI